MKPAISPYNCSTCKTDCRYAAPENDDERELSFDDWIRFGNIRVQTRQRGCCRHHECIRRNKILDSIIDLVDGRITGLDLLLATPPEERTETAQDKYLKQARFELGLVQDEYTQKGDEEVDECKQC